MYTICTPFPEIRKITCRGLIWDPLLITPIVVVVSLSDKVHAQENIDDVAVDEVRAEENLPSEKHQLPIIDSATSRRMVRKSIILIFIE